MRNALENFIGTVEATGGVLLDEEGHYVPVADPQWMDLGDAYLLACEALQRQPTIVATSDREEVVDEGRATPLVAMREADKVAFNELWDALSAILEEPKCVLPDELREQSLWAIDRAQHVTGGIGFPGANPPVELVGVKGETSRQGGHSIEDNVSPGSGIVLRSLKRAARSPTPDGGGSA